MHKYLITRLYERGSTDVDLVTNDAGASRVLSAFLASRTTVTLAVHGGMFVAEATYKGESWTCVRRDAVGVPSAEAEAAEELREVVEALHEHMVEEYNADCDLELDDPTMWRIERARVLTDPAYVECTYGPEEE